MRLSLLIATVFFAFPLILFSQAGKLDYSFGINGKLITDFNENDDYAYAIAVQQDGKILVGGKSTEAYALIRYNINGSIDSSFGSNGKIVMGFDSTNNYGIHSILVQPDGKIIASGSVGSTYYLDFFLVRYTKSGKVDSSFGINGITKTDFGSSYNAASSTIFTNDSKIVIIGTGKSSEYPQETNVFLIARYTPYGLPDSTFGVNGKIATGFGYQDAGYSVLVQSDNKLIASGFKDSLAGNLVIPLIAVVRYQSNGSIDSSFGNNGLSTVNINSPFDAGVSSVLQPDNKIIISASSQTGSKQVFTLIRLNINGTLDSSFGLKGVATADLSKINENSYLYDDAYSVDIQKDGRIVQAGVTFNGVNLDFGVARYNSNGSLDSSFAINGTTLTPIGNYDDVGISTKIQEDGKILVAGYSFNGTDYDFALARYNNDVILPVNFTSFTATKNKQSVILDWNTCNEINSNGFYIQRSSTINDWKDIGYVSSKDINKGCNDYSYTDTKPLPGNNFYRLKQVDDDGKFSFSKIENIIFEKLFITISPNPVKNILMIKSLGNNINSILRIMNANGNTISYIQTTNDVFNWNIQNLSAGNYFLVVQQNNKIISSLKFFKE